MTLRHRLWSLLAMALVLLSIGVVSSAGAAELTRQASASGAAASYTYDGPRQHARTAITPRDAPRRGSDPPVMARLMPRKQLTSGFAAEDVGAGSLRFSQTTASSTFRNGPLAGRSIGEVASGLRSGAIKPGGLPVDVINRGGNLLSLNTRSTLALMRGGVDPADWVLNDVTGDAFLENVLTQRLASNGLTDAGTDVLRITGARPWASWLG